MLIYRVNQTDRLNLNLGLREHDSNNLIGFVHSEKIRMRIKDHEIDAAEVNFLCLHKNYRKKRLSPYLIQEITQLSNSHHLYQALFTSAAKITEPLCTAGYDYFLENL